MKPTGLVPRAEPVDGLINFWQALVDVIKHGQDRDPSTSFADGIFQTRDILYLDVITQDLRHVLDFLTWIFLFNSY